jgi:putative transposase
MARRSRKNVLYDGCFAHIYSRALEKKFVFNGPKDFEYFKALLKNGRKEYEYLIHHYCLMNTHFHLVVFMKNVEKFSSGMKTLKQQYALYVQEKYRKAGPVWWGRFGSRLIENESYLYACGLYIEMNPLKAGMRMIRAPQDWAYSSSRHYFLGLKDELIDPYEQPAFEVGRKLMEKINFERESILGSELFQIYSRENLSPF